MACINITIDYAAPIKAKLLLSFLTMRITFIDTNTGLPIIKSSQTINAVSYYENSFNVMPVMTKTAEIESDKYVYVRVCVCMCTIITLQCT